MDRQFYQITTYHARRQTDNSAKNWHIHRWTDNSAKSQARSSTDRQFGENLFLQLEMAPKLLTTELGSIVTFDMIFGIFYTRREIFDARRKIFDARENEIS